MRQITNNVYAETELSGCNHGFVVTKEGVVMIDTPQMPADAIRWRDEIAKYGPVRYIIITEPHGDHYSGSYFFEGTVVAHEGTRDAIRQHPLEQFMEALQKRGQDSLPFLPGGFHFRLPTITLSQQLTLYLGNHTFQLINLPGHTPYEVVVYIPEERVAFTSDNIFHKVQAWLYQALPYDWLDSLKRIQELEADVLIPGHGSICDRDYIPEMSTFIQDWIDTATDAINQGMSLKEAQDKISHLDRYPMETGAESMAQEVQRMNVARLYEVLKSGKKCE